MKKTEKIKQAQKTCSYFTNGRCCHALAKEEFPNAPCDICPYHKDIDK